MNTGEAKKQYNDALKDLEKFCQQAANFDVNIEEEEYPFRVKLIRNRQMTFLDADGADNEEIVISAGLDTVISSGGSINMSAGVLKKIINKVEEVGRLYYHAYHEKDDEEGA